MNFSGQTRTDKMQFSEILSVPRCRRRRAQSVALACALLAFVSALVTISFTVVLPSSGKYVLEDKDCPEEQQASGSCHVDGNQQWKDEDVSDRWSTADWMNGYNEVTDSDVNSDEYQPWADKLKSSLGVLDTDPTLGTTILPPFPPIAQFVTGTTVIVPTCDPLWGCKQNAACIDRYQEQKTVA